MDSSLPPTPPPPPPPPPPLPSSVDAVASYRPTHTRRESRKEESSDPIGTNEFCVDIPENEDNIFKAVRYNDLTMITRRINEGFLINTPHTDNSKLCVYISACNKADPLICS